MNYQENLKLKQKQMVFSPRNIFVSINLIETILPGSSFNGLGTTSLLILVGVILDLSREIQSIILSNIYNDMFN